MTTASDSSSDPVAGDKNARTRLAHGLTTPEQTPEPEIARLEEDEKRRQANSQNSTAEGQGSTTGDPQSSGERSGGDTGGNNGAVPEQIDAVERVMKCSSTDYRQVLGLGDENPNREEESRKVMAAFKKLGCLTHEKYNKVNHAAQAFHRVNDAAKHLGINEAAIAKMRDWDGVEDNLTLPENDTSHESSGEAPSTRRDMDMGNSNQPTTPQLTDAHRDVYRVCEGLLGILTDDPENEQAIGGLQGANRKIMEINAANGFNGSDRFVVDVETWVNFFKRALPFREQLKQRPDQNARHELKLMNDWIQQFNQERGYPPGWVIAIPKPPDQPTSGPIPPTPATTTTRARSGRLPKSLAFNERDGCVLEGGIEKELYGYMKAGYGHRVLLRQDGRNGYDIFEFVRASKFGKSFVERNQHVLGGTDIKAGTKASLRGMSWNQVAIFGVAPVRTDFDDEAMLMAWVAFPDREPTWYWRSYLGEEFGIDAVDEKLNTFRRKAGQLPRAVIEEDEAEESDYDEEREDKETRMQYLREEMKRLEEGTARRRGSSGAKKAKPRRRAR